MSSSPGPTVTRRRLRAELRRLRLERQLSIEHVANEQEWSASKLVRIENGQVGISKPDLNALLDLYGVKNRRYREELQELARASRQRMWWSRYQRYLPAALLEFIGAEFDASRITYFQPLIVPTVFQTRAYASVINATTGTAPVPPEVAEARVEVRLKRQHELLEGDSAREIVAIIDEAVLRRPVGDQNSWREQLDRIADLADSGPVRLVVLPFSAGPHLGMVGPFALMDYPDPQDGGVLYLENAAGGIVLRDDLEAVESYHAGADRLIDMGLRDKAAVEFVRRIPKELT